MSGFPIKGKKMQALRKMTKRKKKMVGVLKDRGRKCRTGVELSAY